MIPTRATTNTEVRPVCPLCNGTLTPLRGQFRCARCCFILCDGCDGEAFAGQPPALAEIDDGDAKWSE